MILEKDKRRNPCRDSVVCYLHTSLLIVPLFKIIILPRTIALHTVIYDAGKKQTPENDVNKHINGA